MKTYVECVGCLAKQAAEISMMCLPEDAREAFLRDILFRLSRFDYQCPPPVMTMEMYSLIRSEYGENDPYASVKKLYNSKALEMYDLFSEKVSRSADPFDTALRIAVAGNIIDFGSGTRHSIEVEHTIDNALEAGFAIDHVSELKERLHGAKLVLYIGDNAGEIVFDKLLIERIGPSKVTFATRDLPIINDVTLEDAESTGMTDLCTVISSGSRAPGTPIESCSDEFRELFDSADVVISKGQGNFETLSGSSRDVFFLLMVKCPVISRVIGPPVGSFIAMNNNHPPA